jgi:hypothetical protein
VLVFDKVLGIPAHPLILHAAVIFIPLLVLGAIVYPLLPRVRGRIDWAVTALAVIAPLAALFTKLSGDAFRARLVKDRVSAQIVSKVDAHRALGTATVYWTTGLAVVTLVVLFYMWRARRANQTVPGSMWIASGVVMIALSIVTGYYVFRTGDTGAHVAWSGY